MGAFSGEHVDQLLATIDSLLARVRELETELAQVTEQRDRLNEVAGEMGRRLSPEPAPEERAVSLMRALEVAVEKAKSDRLAAVPPETP